MVVGLPEVETCDECQFDASRWSRQDAIRTVEHAADLVNSAVEGLAPNEWLFAHGTLTIIEHGPIDPGE